MWRKATIPRGKRGCRSEPGYFCGLVRHFSGFIQPVEWRFLLVGWGRDEAGCSVGRAGSPIGFVKELADCIAKDRQIEPHYLLGDIT